MKYKLHIPTEQYGYIEVDGEAETIEEAVESYPKASNLPSGEGLELKVWNDTLVAYLETNTLVEGAELYNQMSSQQQMVIQEIKKAVKRLKAREQREMDGNNN